MLTEVSPNKTELWIRIILQIALFAALCYLIYVIVFPKGVHHFHDQIIKDWCYLLVFLLFNVSLFLQLYYLPFWIIIDDELKTLEIKYVMLPSKVIGKFDIAGYTTTTIKSRSSSCFGIFLNLTNGKKILVSDLTFTNYMPVELFLEDLKITKSGEEDFSFFSYYGHQ